MSKANGNDPAFPVDGEYAGESLRKGTSELTKREIFAATAIEGKAYLGMTDNEANELARVSVLLSNALIKELNIEQDERD